MTALVAATLLLPGVLLAQDAPKAGSPNAFLVKEARVTGTGRPSALDRSIRSRSAPTAATWWTRRTFLSDCRRFHSSLTTNISTADADRFFADRHAHGFNADWVNLLTAGANMAGRDDGSTYDGIRPFAGHIAGGPIGITMI